MTARASAWLGSCDAIALLTAMTVTSVALLTLIKPALGSLGGALDAVAGSSR